MLYTQDRIRASDILRESIETEHGKYDRLSDEVQDQYSERLEVTGCSIHYMFLMVWVNLK